MTCSEQLLPSKLNMYAVTTQKSRKIQNSAVSSYKCWRRPTICRTDTHRYCKRNYETYI